VNNNNKNCYSFLVLRQPPETPKSMILGLPKVTALR